jgi:hypothetical protein
MASSFPDRALWRKLARAAGSAPPGANILNASFEPARTPCDWLSRDPKVVDAFLSDALCFAQLQPKSFASFLAAAPRLSEGESLRKIRSDLPIYVFSGSEDPVGLRLHGVGILIEGYRKSGINRFTTSLTSQTRSVTPAAIAGVILSVWWMRTKLYNSATPHPY